MGKIILEINDYVAEFDENEEEVEKAKKFFEEEIPKMEFKSIDDLVSFVYALRQYADEFLEIVMQCLPEDGSNE